MEREAQSVYIGEWIRDPFALRRWKGEQRRRAHIMFYAYLLRCSDGSYYAGHTQDIEARMAAHHDGFYPGYTKNRRPVELLWVEGFETREEALAGERQIKGWRRTKKEAMVAGDWHEVVRLARLRPPMKRVVADV